MRLPRIAAVVAVYLLAASAGQAADVAILKSSDVPAWRPVLDGLRKVATGHNVVELDLKNDKAEGERLLAGLKGRPVVLVGMGALAARMAREALPDQPLVFCMVPDPEKDGLVVGPGLAGVTFSTPIRNQLAAFRQVAQKVVKIGVIYNEENSGKLVQEAARSVAVLRLIVVPKAVPTEKEIPQALRDLLTGDDAVDALWIPPDPVLLGDETRRYLLTETFKAAKPVYAFNSSLVQEGALASNGADYGSIGEQAGELVNRLAAGEKGRIELLVPRAELWINKKIASKLKIDVPGDVMKPPARVLQ